MLDNGNCVIDYFSDPCYLKNFRFITNGSCTAACPNGFYTNNASFCIPCLTGCSTCTDGSACVNCINGFTFDFATGKCICYSFTYDPPGGGTQLCLAICPPGYYKEATNKTCTQCPFKCRECTAGNNCFDCYEPASYVVDSVNKTCVCIPGKIMGVVGNCFPDPATLPEN